MALALSREGNIFDVITSFVILGFVHHIITCSSTGPALDPSLWLEETSLCSGKISVV